MEQRLIDANKVNPSDVFGGITDFAQNCRNAVVELLNVQSTVEAVPVVRCGECKHWHEGTEWCSLHSTFINHNCEPCSPSESSNWKTFSKTDFCSYGERRATP